MNEITQGVTICLELGNKSAPTFFSRWQGNLLMFFKRKECCHEVSQLYNVYYIKGFYKFLLQGSVKMKKRRLLLLYTLEGCHNALKRSFWLEIWKNQGEYLSDHILCARESKNWISGLLNLVRPFLHFKDFQCDFAKCHKMLIVSR